MHLDRYPQPEQGGFVAAKLLGYFQGRVPGRDTSTSAFMWQRDRRPLAEFFKLARIQPRSMARSLHRMSGHYSTLAFRVSSR